MVSEESPETTFSLPEEDRHNLTKEYMHWDHRAQQLKAQEEAGKKKVDQKKVAAMTPTRVMRTVRSKLNVLISVRPACRPGRFRPRRLADECPNRYR